MIFALLAGGALVRISRRPARGARRGDHRRPRPVHRVRYTGQAGSIWARAATAMASDRLGSTQLPLPLDPTPAYGREDFLVADCTPGSARLDRCVASLAGTAGRARGSRRERQDPSRPCLVPPVERPNRRPSAPSISTPSPTRPSRSRMSTGRPDDARLLHVLNRVAGGGRTCPDDRAGGAGLLARPASRSGVPVAGGAHGGDRPSRRRPDHRGPAQAVRDRQIEVSDEAIAYLLRHMERSPGRGAADRRRSGRVGARGTPSGHHPALRRVLEG